MFSQNNQSNKTGSDQSSFAGGEDFSTRIDKLTNDLEKQVKNQRETDNLVKLGWIVIILSVVALFSDVIFHKESKNPQINVNVTLDDAGQEAFLDFLNESRQDDSRKNLNEESKIKFEELINPVPGASQPLFFDPSTSYLEFQQ